MYLNFEADAILTGEPSSSIPPLAFHFLASFFQSATLVGSLWDDSEDISEKSEPSVQEEGGERGWITSMINDSIPKSDEPTNRVQGSFAERFADDGVWTLDKERGKY